MMGVYLAAAAFGVVLVGANVALGGDGLDKDLDLHTDGDLDHGAVDLVHGDVGPFLPWTSLRFWSFFAAAFGVTGGALAMAGMADLFSALVAVPTGVGVGTAAAWVMRQIRADRVSGDVTLERYAGEEGKVVVPVRGGRTGKIRIVTKSGLIELPARTADGHDLGVGDRVLVASVRDGVADVTRLGVRTPGREAEGG